MIEMIDKHAGGIDLPYIDYKGRYLVGAREYDGLVFISGNACEDPMDGHPVWTGAIGAEVSAEEGYKAAQYCGLLHLGFIRDHYGLDRVESIVRAYCLICVADDFYDLDGVFDGYSDLMYAALRERGRHVRTLMGTRHLPNHHVSIEVETICKLRP